MPRVHVPEIACVRARSRTSSDAPVDVSTGEAASGVHAGDRARPCSFTHELGRAPRRELERAHARSSASALALTSQRWRPGIDLGAGVDLLASASASASRRRSPGVGLGVSLVTSASRRRPQHRPQHRPLGVGLGVGVGLATSHSLREGEDASSSAAARASVLDRRNDRPTRLPP